MNISPQIEAAAASTRSESEVRQQRISMVDAINPNRTRFREGMSDDQLDYEHRAQMAFTKAVTEMRDALKLVNYLSSVVTVDCETFDNLVHDEFPSIEHWDEKIAEARR